MKIENIFKRSLNIKKKDKILIVTDNNKLKIAKKFLKSLKRLSNNVNLMVKNVGNYDGEEPSKKVSEEMKKSNIVIAVTTYSLTHTNARRKASKRGVKVVTMPGFIERMLPSLKPSPRKMLGQGKKIENILRKTKTVKVVTDHGTDLLFSVKGRFIDIDAGIFNKPGSFGNMPSGEISTSPVEGTAKGMLIINSMADYAKNKTVVYIEKGKAVDINDKKCKLAKIFRILQDEKVLGTCHIAFGNNKSYRGKVYSKVHLDAILFKPTIWFDKKKIMSKGRLKI